MMIYRSHTPNVQTLYKILEVATYDAIPAILDIAVSGT